MTAFAQTDYARHLFGKQIPDALNYLLRIAQALEKIAEPPKTDAEATYQVYVPDEIQGHFEAFMLDLDGGKIL